MQLIEATTPVLVSPSKKETATSLVKKLRKGKELHDEFTREFRETYKIAGQLMGEWQDHFALQIPIDPNIATIQELDVRLVELHQEASFLKAVADCKLRAYNGVTSRDYNIEYARLVTEYKTSGQKLPAKDTLQALTEKELGGMKEGLVHAEIELSFWKDVLNDLSNSRKVIENLTLNISVEAKALSAQRYMDALAKKEQ